MISKEKAAEGMAKVLVAGLQEAVVAVENLRVSSSNSSGSSGGLVPAGLNQQLLRNNYLRDTSQMTEGGTRSQVFGTSSVFQVPLCSHIFLQTLI
jgi:hypothetical protein